MKYDHKKSIIENIRESVTRRQSESYERFIQEKAGFWSMNA